MINELDLMLITQQLLDAFECEDAFEVEGSQPNVFNAATMKKMSSTMKTMAEKVNKLEKKMHHKKMRCQILYKKRYNQHNLVN